LFRLLRPIAETMWDCPTFVGKSGRNCHVSPTPKIQHVIANKSTLFFSCLRLLVARIRSLKSRACHFHFPISCIRLKNKSFRLPFSSAKRTDLCVASRLLCYLPDRALSNSAYHPGVSLSNEFSRSACFVGRASDPACQFLVLQPRR
jgi:hypothetical protein